MITMAQMQALVALLRAHHVPGDYVMRLHPSRAQSAFEQGLAPLCPLTDDKFIEAVVYPTPDAPIFLKI